MLIANIMLFRLQVTAQTRNGKCQRDVINLKRTLSEEVSCFSLHVLSVSFSFVEFCPEQITATAIIEEKVL